MAQLKLTKSAIDRLSHPRKGQRHYWDTQLRGFGLVIGRNTKTFVVQRDINGQTRRMKIGRYGTPPPPYPASTSFPSHGTYLSRQ
jgi:hypothetical protein